MEDGVGNGSSVGFIRLEDEKETFVIGCSEGGEGGNFLERLVVFDIS